MAAFRLDHKDFRLFVMGKGPAHGFCVLLGDQHDAMAFGAAILQLAPMLHGKIGIAAAVRLEGGLVILQADDKGQDGRLVSGEARFSYEGANGRAP